MKHNPVLHKTPLFWLAIIIPAASATFFCWMIYNGSPELSYSYKSSDIGNLLDAYKLPIAIFGLSIPFVAVVAAIHRSSQTAHQIEAQQSQNNFVNHFKHIEEFKKAFGGSTLPPGWGNAESFHRSMFPNSIEGDYKGLYFSKNYSSELLSDVISICKRHPSKILMKSTNLYKQAVTRLDPSINFLENSTIKPEGFLTLVHSAREALIFSGLNPSPFEIEQAHVVELNELSKIADVLERYESNTDIVRDALLRNDFVPFGKDLSIDGNRLYEQLGFSYAWSCLTSKDQDLISEKANDEVKKYVQDHLKPIQEMTLDDYIKIYKIRLDISNGSKTY